MNYIYMIMSWVLLVSIKAVLSFIGLFVVPISLLGRTEHIDTEIGFTQNVGNWMLVSLPRWAWLWSNDRDGALGDKRGWWDDESGGSRKMWSMFQWLAVRNPVNNLGFLPFFSCDISKSKIEHVGGVRVSNYKSILNGWQLLKANDGTFNYYHFFYFSDNFYVRIGHKIKLEHNTYEHNYEDPTKSLKSFTFRFKVQGAARRRLQAVVVATTVVAVVVFAVAYDVFNILGVE